MAPAKHSEDAETSFLNELLADFDRDFSTTSQPKRSPEKPCVATPTKSKEAVVVSEQTSTVEDACDVAALLDGAENWDWDDFGSDILTPKKQTSPSPTKVSVVLLIFSRSH